MTIDQRTQLAFLIAWASRMATIPMVAHWGLIGGTRLIGVPSSWAGDISLVHTAGLGAGCSALVWLFRRQPHGVEWVRSKLDRMLKYSAAVLVAAATSNGAGIALFVEGETTAALWAMGLSTLVMLCEATALIASQFLDAGQSPQRD